MKLGENQEFASPGEVLTHLTQDGEEFVNDILSHHGVKGMRWGVRNEEKTAGKQAKREVKAAKLG